jgi:L-2-aminoadipate reductase
MKTRIPALRLSDDGMLSGGAEEGRDVFAGTTGKASSLSNVLVGLEQSSALWFTSGTEGRSKSFVWMA